MWMFFLADMKIAVKAIKNGLFQRSFIDVDEDNRHNAGAQFIYCHSQLRVILNVNVIR